MKFSCEMTPRYKDIDRMGYVHNSVYQVLFEEGRIAMTASTGYTYGDLEDDGVLLPISEAHYYYKVPIFYQDKIKVYIWINYIKTFSMKICFRITKDDDKTIVAEGYSIHAAVDAATKEFTEVPQNAADLWGRYIEKE
ncbi:MAG: acyl-CoA thioesterase, partial [Spirochaetales bacterium]|nr:acyl-CoA thioesterase [Spirochaetales bacterium]